MFEDITPESIKKDILSDLTSVDTREGSYTNNLVGPVAMEMWKVYDSMNAVVPIVCIDETSGEYIDKRCAERGIIRKAGTKAHAELTFTGNDGTIIPAGTIFLTLDGLEYETIADATILGGTATATVNAVEVGKVYNVAAGSIVNQYTNISGLSAVTNAAAAAGGTDPESDKSLVDRYYNYLQKPVTSGNVHHYEQWAMEVNGVGAVKVAPLVNGPGTVGVMIVGEDRKPVSGEVVSACSAHIEENRPIGPVVTVESATSLSINVTVAAILGAAVTADTVQNALSNKLQNYLESIVNDYFKSNELKPYMLLYNRVAYFLLGIDGVEDCTDLKVNGGTENITIAADQVPVIGTVVVS